MKTLIFNVYGLPQGKGAARHTKKGFTYTPTKTRDYMAQVTEAAENAGAIPYKLPCSIKIFADFPIPNSYSNKEKAEIRTGHRPFTKKPDTDNIAKIKDALNGVAFLDDSQVFHEVIFKRWSETPRLRIELTYYETSELLPSSLLSYAPVLL